MLSVGVDRCWGAGAQGGGTDGREGVEAGRLCYVGGVAAKGWGISSGHQRNIKWASEEHQVGIRGISSEHQDRTL